MGFGLKSVGHFFATVVHDLKVGAHFLASHEKQIDQALETGAAVIGLADPALAPIAIAIDRASERVLGEFLAVVAKLSQAEEQHGANVAFDADVIQSGKALLKDIETFKRGLTVPPAGLPATAK